MVVLPKGYTAVRALLSLRVLVMVTAEQLSVAVAVPGLTIAVHRPLVVLAVIFAGQLITGLTVSFTVTVNVLVVILLEASLAVIVTVVVPAGNAVPDAGEAVTITPGQLSVAVVLNVTTLLQLLEAAFTVIFDGHEVITGFCMSFTIMVKEQVAPVDEVTVTVVTPTLKNEPLALL